MLSKVAEDDGQMPQQKNSPEFESDGNKKNQEKLSLPSHLEDPSFRIYGFKRFTIRADNKWQNLKIFNPSIEGRSGTESISCEIRICDLSS